MDGMDNNIQNGNVPNNDAPMTNSVPNNGPVMGSVPTNNMDSNSPKKANTKFIIIGVVVAVLLIAGIGGLFGYKSYVGKPINLYTGAIEKLYEDFSEALNSTETFDITKDSIVMSGDLKLNSSLAELEDYTKYTYDFDLGLDLKNKKMQMGASMNDESKEIISAVMYYLDKNVYLDSKQIYDKVLYMVMEEDVFADLEVDETTIDYEKIDKIAEKVTKYVINGLDESKFEKKDATVKINGKDVKVTKVIYPINQDTVYAMATSLLKDIKGDDELLGLIADIAGVEKSQIKDALAEVEFEKDDFKMEAKADFYLYTNGFFEKVVGFGFEAEAKIEGETEKATIYYVENDDNAVFSMDVDGLDITANTVGNKTDGKIKIEGQELASFTLNYVEKDKNTKMDLTVTVDVEGTKLVLDYSADVTEESDKKAKGTFDVNLAVTSEGQTVEVGGKANLNVEIGGKVEGINTSGAVDFETLDSTELEKIQTNLENALKDTFLYDLLMAEDDSYDDYDDDWASDDWDSDDWYTDESDEDF